MRKGLFLILSLFMFNSHAFGFELFYPTEKSSIVNSEYAFFVGNTNNGESITINDEWVPVASNGAFAHSVKLNDGENRIKLKSSYGVQFYKIYKNVSPEVELPTESFEPQKAFVKNDNTPLRSTPIDGGLNRIGHLFANTSIILNGSQGKFYRVFLSKDKVAWIAKDDVMIDTLGVGEISEFLSMDSQCYKNANIQTITFSKILPYTVEETNQEILFRVYNPEQSDNSVYTLNIPKPKKYTYSISSDSGKYTFKVKQLPKEVSEITIAVDAGHGGSEKGAIGCLGDEEKDINLKIANELAAQLREKGFTVVTTRECDANVSLNNRVQMAKENGADIFISIHLNSIGGNTKMEVLKTRGTSVYYFNNNANELASIVEKNVSSSAGTRRDGIHAASFAVVRPTDYIGILVECAYMTNPFDSVLYRKNDFAKKVAKGIAKSVEKYITAK